MKKNNLITPVILASIFFAGVAVAGTPNLHRKQHKQQVRIIQGVKSGELTRRETKTLAKGQWQLQRMKQRAKADGIVTPRERLKLQIKAKTESAKIFRNKHDVQKRPRARR